MQPLLRGNRKEDNQRAMQASQSPSLFIGVPVPSDFGGGGMGDELIVQKKLCSAQKSDFFLSSKENVIIPKTVILKPYQLYDLPILGDPGAVSGGRESLNRREKNSGEEKSRTKIRAPGDKVLTDQFQTVGVILASDWCQKIFVFFCPITEQQD